MPTREQIESELRNLPPEQHAAFLAEVERRMGGVPAEAPEISAQAETPGAAPGESEYQQALSDVDTMMDVGKGAVQGAATIGAGAMRPAEDVRDFVLRKMGLGSMADELGSQREGAMSAVREMLAPHDKDATFAHGLGRVAASAAPLIAAPSAALPQALLGATVSGSEALGRSGDYGEAAGDAALGAALPYMGKVAAKVAGPLRRLALKTYSGLLVPQGATGAERVAIEAKLEPILEELPAGFRGHIQRSAEKTAGEVGAKQAELYGAAGKTPASFKSTIKKLSDAADEQVRTKGGFVSEAAPTGEISKEWVPPDVRNQKIYDALRKEMHRAKTAQRTADELGRPIDVEEMYKTRKSLYDELATAKRKAFKPGAPKKGEPVKLRALKTHARGVSEELHGLVKGGKEIDELFSSWKTVAEGATGPDPGNFISRWFLSRQIPGQTGTAAGAVAAKPALTRSLTSKALVKMSQALKVGDKPRFLQIMREMAEGNEEL